MLGPFIILSIGVLFFYLRFNNKFPYKDLYDKNDEDYIYDLARYIIPGWAVIIIMILGGVYGIIVNL
ncbi:hypothetical protein KRE40_07760 [Elizabethkingia meningoseptica]|uniref:Uncharacterized protein n=1 Tax=Elizabethkingia meningoseptica TaxID=238 RepID=A0A1V3TW60_ELIME|nr:MULTISPECIES: hypothetical protein [Elizabethkingia]AQX04349.1 hypothetical protein BBD33_03385 [Elizabethkingia meningoseptica]AQX11814.1 hypothetical protein BBD35_05215 [Elizabethkingia meningoseptica]AQX46391.1 hypothetical protein B5G46_03380 [Elizabethkingia meningoseptica]KUY18906.1 hypothetical protein ATB99_03790 [Elizabethkingia meningoseptica]MBG0513260.1 hypothetical protein [Elizabethkingia meningoseptica]